MSTLFVLAFIGPISWFYHPEPMHNGICYAKPGSFTALWCPPHAPTSYDIRPYRSANITGP